MTTGQTWLAFVAMGVLALPLVTGILLRLIEKWPERKPFPANDENDAERNLWVAIILVSDILTALITYQLCHA